MAQKSHPGRVADRIWPANGTDIDDYGEAVEAASAAVPYLVMESLPGHTLQDRLTAGPLAPRAALRTVSEVAAALAAMHEAGRVHGDIKPSNVMLTPSGAKVLDSAGGGRPEPHEHAHLYGTPPYLAPERTGGDVIRPASDVYSLGLLIYHSLTGRLPRLADTSTALADARGNDEPEALPYISGVGPEVEDVYARCLARDAADRPTAAQVAAVLEAAAGIVTLAGDATDVDLVPVPSSTDDNQVVKADRPRRRGAALAVVGLVVLALIALAITAWWPGGSPARGSAPSSAVGTAGAEATPGVTATIGATSTPDPAGPSSGPTPGSTGAAVGPSSAPSAAVPSAGSGPVGTPTPTGAPTTPPVTSAPTSTATPPPGLLVTSTGGTVVVTCVGILALMALPTPAAGYRLGAYKPGPASSVEAVFASSSHRSEIDATCRNGVATPTVKES